MYVYIYIYIYIYIFMYHRGGAKHVAAESPGRGDDIVVTNDIGTPDPN